MYDDNLGALLIGQMVSTFLYGISTLQTYVYLMRFPRDRPELKIWVLLVWSLNTADVVLVCHGLYFWAWAMVVEKTEPASGLAHESFAKRSFNVSAVLSLVVAAVVQFFFIKRIHTLCQTTFTRYTLPTIMTLFTFTHLGFGAEAVVKVISTFNGSSLESLTSITFSATLPYTLLGVLSNGFLAGTLTVMSRGRTLRLENLQVHSLLRQSTSMLVHRCILLTLAALARLVAFTIVPWTAWFIAADFIMGKLYANSFLACLNARANFPGANGSLVDSAIFTSFPDISVRSSGSAVIPTPVPGGRPVSRAVSLPDLVFCKNAAKCGILASAAAGAQEPCACMLEARPDRALPCAALLLPA